ncbi:MAG: putative damage-inducible protein DinB [Crocinitomicaceae bacterium]|jgi:uncharacterized damage-inducible protein DinB
MQDHLIKEFEIRVFDESYTRISKCLNLLNEDEIWYAPNDQITTVGNTVLHLIGNARQWIIAGIGQEEDNRERDDEFKVDSRVSKVELESALTELQKDLEPVLFGLNNNQINKVTNVQGFEVSGFSILIHVIEHFSYHTGQISLLTKLMKNEDLGYYELS